MIRRSENLIGALPTLLPVLLRKCLVMLSLALIDKSRVITCHLQVLNGSLVTYVIMRYEHGKK